MIRAVKKARKPVTVMPRILNGKRRIQIIGNSMSARIANGQQRTNKIIHSKNFVMSPSPL
jgi:hypothetical protein